MELHCLSERAGSKSTSFALIPSLIDCWNFGGQRKLEIQKKTTGISSMFDFHFAADYIQIFWKTLEILQMDLGSFT